MRTKGRLLCLLLPFVLACILSASAVRAQTSSFEVPSGEDVMKAIIVFIFGDQASSGIPDSWLTYGGFMQNIVFPFIAVFVVMYGILSEIRIFHEAKVKAILALVMAFVGGYAVLWTMRGFLVINALWGTVGFGVLMFLGILLWAARGIMENLAGLGKPYYALTGKHLTEQMNRAMQIKRHEDNIMYLRAAMAKNPSPAIIEELRKEQDRLDDLLKKQEGRDRSMTGVV